MECGGAWWSVVGRDGVWWGVVDCAVGRGGVWWDVMECSVMECMGCGGGRGVTECGGA